MPRTLFRADAVVATWLCLCALCLVVAVSAVELDRTRHPHQRPHLTRAGRHAGYGSVNWHVHRAHAEPSEEEIDNAENTLQPAPTTDADKSNSDPSSVSTSQSVSKSSSATSLSPVSVCVQDDRPDVLLPMAVQAVNGKELTTYCTSPRVIRRLYQQLRIIDELFQKHGVEYYAIGGTLIGAIRSNGIIPWDDDGDLIVNDFDKSKIQSSQFKSDLEQRGMRLIRHEFGFKIDFAGDPQIKHFGYNHPNTDIFVHHWVNDVSVFEGTQQWPNDAIRRDEVYPLRRQTFGDFELFVPNKSDEYLARVHSDWKTHARVGTRHDLEMIPSPDPVALDRLPAGPAKPFR